MAKPACKSVAASDTPDYPVFLAVLKERILNARITAARAINHELVLLYWDNGGGIVEKQRFLGWGESVIDRVSADLRAAFPDCSGFSARNLSDMKRLYVTFENPAMWRQAVAKLKVSNTESEILRPLGAEIPWGHHLLILNQLLEPSARLYYLRATSQFGWSRNVLLNQIKAGTCERADAEKTTHNFAIALPEDLAEKPDEMLKSRYNLEFPGLERALKEHELEKLLVSRLHQFILELGFGFCFVGRQYRLTLGQKRNSRISRL